MTYGIVFLVALAVTYGLWRFLTGGRKTPRYEYKVDTSGNEYVHDHHDFSVRDLTADQGLTFSNKPNYPLRRDVHTAPDMAPSKDIPVLDILGKGI